MPSINCLLSSLLIAFTFFTTLTFSATLLPNNEGDTTIHSTSFFIVLYIYIYTLKNQSYYYYTLQWKLWKRSRKLWGRRTGTSVRIRAAASGVGRRRIRWRGRKMLSLVAAPTTLFATLLACKLIKLLFICSILFSY